MSHTFIASRVHIVFSTKDRRRQIRPEMQKKLWAYIAGTAKNLDIAPIIIGGTDDHAHLLLSLPATLSVSTAVQKLKANSSRWMSENGTRSFEWQPGYSAFSVGVSQEKATICYIENQLAHHHKQDFREEMRLFLQRHGAAVPSLRDSETSPD